MPPTTLVRIGILGCATGVLGAFSAALMLTWPAQVPETVLSYPFSPIGFRNIQLWFCVHHLGLLALLVGLVLSGAVGGGWSARASAWVGVAGMVMLTGMELFAIPFATTDTQAANEGIMGAGYGIATTVIGLGMLGAGAGVLRAGRWSGWRRWIPLLLGLSLFGVVTPAMFGGFVAARLGIGSWMLVFAALGLALVIESRVASGDGRSVWGERAPDPAPRR